MNVMNSRKATKGRIGVALVLGCVLAFPVAGEIPADQISRLGADLTPLGGGAGMWIATSSVDHSRGPLTALNQLDISHGPSR